MSDATLRDNSPLKSQNDDFIDMPENRQKNAYLYVGDNNMYESMTTKKQSEPIQTIATYLRCSTEDQSTDSQVMFVNGLVTSNGFKPENVMEFKDEGISVTKMGNLSDRPQGKELIEAIESGEITHVFAFRVDRMFRDLEAGAAFIKWINSKHPDVSVITTDAPVPLNTPDGEFLFGMQVLLARREAGVLAVRTEAGMDATRRNLKPTSHAVYGWNICHTPEGGKTMRPNWREQDVLDWMASEYKKGKSSYSKLAKQLTKWGIKTKTGRDWKSSSVRRCIVTPAKYQEELHQFTRPERKSKAPFRSLSTSQK